MHHKVITMEKIYSIIELQNSATIGIRTLSRKMTSFRQPENMIAL